MCPSRTHLRERRSLGAATVSSATLSGWAVGLGEQGDNSGLRGENPSKPRVGWTWLWQAAGPGAR